MSEELKNVTEVIEERKHTVTPSIEDSVKLKIACVGVGNAGNQAVSKLYKSGYKDYLYAINTSVKDLSDEVVSALIPSFIAGTEARGAGKDREKAMRLFKENGEELFTSESNRFSSIINECDIIIVVFALGGGTGSYIGPAICGILKKMLMNSKKSVIAYGISPKISDSPQSHFNTLEAINELNNIKIPILIDDLSQFEYESSDRAYDIIANNFIEYVKTVKGDYSVHSGNGMMDENDVISLVTAPGYQTHYHLPKITSEMLEKKSLQSYLIDDISKSPSMNFQKDGKIEFMGIITNYPATLREKSKSSDYSEIQNYIGNRAKKLFENYGEVSSSYASFHVIMSGMSLPWDKLSRSEEIIREYEEKKQKSGTNINLNETVAALGSFMNNDSDSKIHGTNSIDKNAAKSALSDFFG